MPDSNQTTPLQQVASSTISGSAPREGKSSRNSCRRLFEKASQNHKTLGTSDTWSIQLRTLIDVVMSAKQPMHLIWGSDRTIIYNDAYAPILARQHPDAMARPLPEIFPTLWSERFEPIIEQVFNGEAAAMKDMEVMIDRNGYPEEVHFSFSTTPVRNETGTIDGLLVVCVETTIEALAARKAQLLEDLTSVLIENADYEKVLSKSCRLLLEALSAKAVAFTKFDEETMEVSIVQSWTDPGYSPFPPVTSMKQLDAEEFNALTRGECIGVFESGRGLNDGAINDAKGRKSILVAPVLEAGKLKATMVVADDVNRKWLSNEADLLSVCADRIALNSRRAASEPVKHGPYPELLSVILAENI